MARRRPPLGVHGRRDTPVRTHLTQFQFFSPEDRDNGVMDVWMSKNDITGEHWTRADFDDGVCFAHFGEGEQCSLTQSEMAHIIFQRKMLELVHAPSHGTHLIQTRPGAITPLQAQASLHTQTMASVPGILARAADRAVNKWVVNTDLNVSSKGIVSPPVKSTTRDKVVQDIVYSTNYYGPQGSLDMARPELGAHLVGRKIQVGWNYNDKRSNKATALWCNGRIMAITPTQESKRQRTKLNGLKTIKTEKDSTRFWNAEVCFEQRCLGYHSLGHKIDEVEDEITQMVAIDGENWNTSCVPKHLRWRLTKE
jgi:hypothetical protein